MSQTQFEKRIFRILQEELSDLEQSALNDSLDDDTDPTEFDVDDDTSNAQADAMVAASSAQQAMVSELRQWIDRIEDFKTFLNGTENSMQTKLHKAAPDTLFDKISKSQTQAIARVAMDISKLEEMLKGFMAQSGNPAHRGV